MHPSPATASVHVRREALGFAAAHFGILGEVRETLHGHNYRIALQAEGAVDGRGTVVDFAALKAAVRAEAERLDHRMIVPTECPEVAVDTESHPGHVGLRYGDARFLFPADDVVLLPLRNTTCECIAAWLLERCRARLGEVPVQLTVTVEESPGQGATVTEERNPPAVH